jgi:indole-3-glycerol phosphate synthase
VKHIPEGYVVVSESGIHHSVDIKALKGLNINAVLVGSSLMGSGDIEGKTREIVEAGK